MSLVPTGAQSSACALGSLPGLQDLLLGLSHLTLLSSPASRSLQTVCRGGAVPPGRVASGKSHELTRFHFLIYKLGTVTQELRALSASWN